MSIKKFCGAIPGVIGISCLINKLYDLGHTAYLFLRKDNYPKVIKPYAIVILRKIVCLMYCI